MNKEDKITLSEWNKLTNAQKEKLRVWVVKHGYELDLLPSSAGSFDPVCDYAALLTHEQMVEFLQEHNQKVFTKSKEQDNCKLLWKQLARCLR